MEITLADINELYQKLVLRSIPPQFQGYDPGANIGDEQELYDPGANTDEVDEYNPEAIDEYNPEAIDEYNPEAIDEYNPGAIDEHNPGAIDEYNPEAKDEAIEYDPTMISEDDPLTILGQISRQDALELLSNIEYAPNAVDAFKKIGVRNNHSERNRLTTWSKHRQNPRYPRRPMSPRRVRTRRRSSSSSRDGSYSGGRDQRGYFTVRRRDIRR